MFLLDKLSVNPLVKGKEVAPSPAAQKLQRRLGKADIQQIRLMLQVAPEKRLETMLEMQEMLLTMWRTRLQASHPKLDNLELTNLVFKRLKQNG